MILYITTGLLMGVVFGFALEKGRVFEPGMIIGQFQMRNFILLRMFLSAVAASLVILGILFGVGLIELHPKAAIFPATILGGFIFGAGMALTGACPGTVLAQIGAGYRDAWGVLAGGIMGAVAYGYMEPVIAPLSKGPGKITLADISGVHYSILAFVAAFVIAAILFAMEKWRTWRSELGADHDGLTG
ncbi:MAG: YeeE/YedE family protein [Candidatus Omnitrophica bacterium]|nr:YeeE/YedE family protein [Candidatus Omnitrophota bacterium]